MTLTQFLCSAVLLNLSFYILFNESFVFSTVLFLSSSVISYSPKESFPPLISWFTCCGSPDPCAPYEGWACCCLPLCSECDFLCVLLTGPALSVCLHLAFLVESLICVIVFSGNYGFDFYFFLKKLWSDYLASFIAVINLFYETLMIFQNIEFYQIYKFYEG